MDEFHAILPFVYLILLSLENEYAFWFAHPRSPRSQVILQAYLIEVCISARVVGVCLQC